MTERELCAGERLRLTSEIEHALGIEPGGSLALSASTWLRHERSRSGCAIACLLCTAALVCIEAWPLDRLTGLLLAGLLAMAVLVAADRGWPLIRVTANRDGLLLIGFLRASRFYPWSALRRAEPAPMWSTEGMECCHQILLATKRLALRPSAEADLLVRAAELVLSAMHDGCWVPGAAAGPPLPSEASLSAVLPNHAEAIDCPRALSPADPPDQLTESQDA